VAIQILWINLVTDALPAMALGVEPPEPDVMQRPPRDPKEKVITLGRGLTIVYQGGLNAAASAVAFYAVYRGRPENVGEARTVAFVTLALCQLLFSFACRSFRYTLPQLGLFTNKWLTLAIAASTLLQVAVVTIPFVRPAFDVVPISAGWEWGVVAAMALTPVTVVEATKLVRAGLAHRRLGERNDGPTIVPTRSEL
jgi:Ca2+-transporting ATPase